MASKAYIWVAIAVVIIAVIAAVLLMQQPTTPAPSPTTAPATKTTATPTATTPAQQVKVVKIGALTPLTGGLQSYGIGMPKISTLLYTGEAK